MQTSGARQMSNETDPSSLARRLLFRELDFNVIARDCHASERRESGGLVPSTAMMLYFAYFWPI